MTNMILAQNKSLTMSSKEIAELTGKEKKTVHRDIKAMCEQLYHAGIGGTVLYHESEGGVMVEFDDRGRSSLIHLDRKHTECLLTGYSVKARMKVIERWHDLENIRQPQLSQIEILAQSALALVEHEKKLNALEQSHLQLENKLEQLKESTAILPKRPANAESVSFIRTRINKKYGLPPRIVNDVLYSSPYAPKPAGQVRNSHEQAGNATYTAWYATDVTKLFARFVSECESVTKTQAVHPSIDGRFKLVINDLTGCQNNS